MIDTSLCDTRGLETDTPKRRESTTEKPYISELGTWGREKTRFSDFVRKLGFSESEIRGFSDLENPGISVPEKPVFLSFKNQGFLNQKNKVFLNS